MFYISKESALQAVRQIERWIFASRTDANPGIALLHANYAVGDLDMLRQMVSDVDIVRMTGKNPLDLLIEATKLQDLSQRKVLQLCPRFLQV